MAGPFDESQSQYINVRTESQELRFTSEKTGGFSWIVGAYAIHTSRFISTGNIVDRGQGVPAVYMTPLLNAANPIATNTNVTFLADSQSNNAWAVFADLNYEFNAQWELDGAIRYDKDQRENTTLTPPNSCRPPRPPRGEQRLASFDAAQPKATLRYKPTEELTFYGGWSRGFRSGGFNQTGVGERSLNRRGWSACTIFSRRKLPIPRRSEPRPNSCDHRLRANLALYDTKSTNGYFFYYDSLTSTQNLGNLDAKYKGAELELTAKATDRLDLYASFGYTDSKITKLETETSVIGNQAPLVSRNTIDAGAQYRQPFGDKLNGIVRLDYHEIGRTWWDPSDSTSRDPVNLVDLRAGLEADKWSVTAWSKNLTNKIYNAEFSPGGFLWRAQPRHFGIDVDYHF
ncbi:MAG: TonB-dependent receptor [Steroidobacteraceae bacterium]